MIDLSSFFLLVFIVSLALTVVMLVTGVAGHSFHIPGVHLDHAHMGHVDGGVHPHLPHLDHGVDHGIGDVDTVSPFNMATILSFATWFGGAGYILTTYTGVLAVVAIVIATLVGLLGAFLAFTFLVRVLLPGQTPYMNEDDFRIVGTVGRLTSGIRPGGTGELVYSSGGARHVISARSEDGEPVERGAEVVVVREERGIVYVQTFERFVESAPVNGVRG